MSPVTMVAQEGLSQFARSPAASTLRHDRGGSVILSFCLQLRTALAIAALTAGVVTATPRSLQASTPAIEDPGVTILVYHRFGPAVKDAMTVRTADLSMAARLLEATSPSDHSAPRAHLLSAGTRAGATASVRRHHGRRRS